MERVKIYPPEVLDSIKSIRGATFAIDTAEQMEAEGKPYAFVREEDGETYYLQPDETVKKVWKGWVYGKIRELKKDGFSEIVTDIFKT